MIKIVHYGSKRGLRIPFFVFDLTFIIFHVIINYKQLGVDKSLAKEIWEDIPGYEGLYKVSSEGRIWGLKSNKILKPKTSKACYQYDLEGNLINSFLSQSQASKETGLSLSSISNCMRGKASQVHGYVFRGELL